MEYFSCKTRVISGRGSLEELGKLGCRRVLVVADPYFAQNGTAEAVAQKTGAPEWEVYGDVSPDPSVELAARGTAKVKDFQPDTLIALGGGSAMDCTKAMAYFSNTQARLIAIPTTSGSGSEVTDFAILTWKNVKYPLVDRKLRPEIAILDGSLLDQLPPALIADTGFDAMSHALEAVAATGGGGFSRALAGDSFCCVYENLQKSYDGDRSVRGQIHEASAMAGLAFTQAGLGLCHGLSHTLGGLYHVPHGRLNAILLPAVITCNQEKARCAYARLARQAGLGAGSDKMAVRNLKNGLIALRRSLHLPATLEEAGVKPGQVQQDLEKILVSVMEDPCCRTNPVEVTPDRIRQVLREVTGFGV